MGGAAEDDALGRLVSGGAWAGGRVVAYGEDRDQVVELYGGDPGAEPDGEPGGEPGGEGGSRCVVVVHGGYFRPSIDRGHARPMARALAATGWTVALLEYRRVPGDPGATLDDLWQADAALRSWGVNPEVWVGHSAGGTLVLLRALADHLPPVRAVALAPVADLAAAVRDRLGDGAVEAWVGQSDLALVDPVGLQVTRADAAEVRGRVTVLHGDADVTVPLGQSLAWSPDAVVVEGAHHFDLVDPGSPVWPRVVEAVGG